jgi:hypothetical protein
MEKMIPRGDLVLHPYALRAYRVLRAHALCSLSIMELLQGRSSKVGRGRL